MRKPKVFPEFETQNPREGVIGLASPKDRLAAAVLDCILVLPIVQILQAPLRRGIYEALLFEQPDQAGALRVYNLIIFFLIFVIYHGAMTFWRGQTLGKMFFQIKVISYQGRLGLFSSFLRSFSLFMEALVFGIPFFALFYHALRRPIHDRLADTLVISLKNPVGFPGLREKGRARWVASAVSFLFLLTLSALFVDEGSDSQAIMAFELFESQENCDRAVSQWGSDLEALMASHLNREVSDECLYEQAREALWEGEKDPQAKFALALSLRLFPEKSNAYLQSVCTGADGHPLCILSQWLMKRDEKPESSATKLVSVVGRQDQSDLARLIVLQLLLEEQEFASMLSLIEEHSFPASFDTLVASLSFHALLGTEKWSEARWVYKTQDHLEPEDLVYFVKQDLELSQASLKKKKRLLEFFYPSLGRKTGRGLASRESPIPEIILELYSDLRGAL